MAVKSTLDTKRINQTGADIQTLAQQMKTSLDNISRVMETSKTYFDSPAAESVRNKYKASAEKYDEFKKEIDSYGQYLKDFAGQVDSFNNQIQEVISTMPEL